MIRIILLVGFLILLGNLLVLNYFVFKSKPAPKVTTTEIIKEKSETCGVDCLAAINAAVDEKVSGLNLKVPTAKPVIPVATGVKTREFIIPLGPGTIDAVNTWADIYTAQTTINTADYPPIQQAYFEVIMHIPNTTGEMSAQLYDTSTPYLFSGQVLTTTSGTGQLLSAPFPIQQGSKNYHVQLYTSISQGVLDSSRIRLLTQ